MAIQECFLLLATLRAHGIRVFVDGDRIEWDAPRGTMKLPWLRELRRRSEELSDLLLLQPELGQPSFAGGTRLRQRLRGEPVSEGEPA